MAPISPCQSGRRVITGDSTAHLSSFLSVCVCVRVFPCACLSGHWSRCGYCAISTIGLRSIASPALLPAHHSVTPCHSPGVQKVMMSFSSQGCLQGSWNTATVSRNPCGLLVESRRRHTDKSEPPASLLCVGMHVHFLSVCM